MEIDVSNRLLAITRQYEEIATSIYTTLGISFPFQSEDNFDYEDKRIRYVQSLWDTGASMTCISDRLAAELELKPLAFVDVATASGIVNLPLFIGHLIFPRQTHFLNWQIAQFQYTDDNCDLIIGMDIITQGDFSITNMEGRTLFSFRIPSLHSVDFEAGMAR